MDDGLLDKATDSTSKDETQEKIDEALNKLPGDLEKPVVPPTKPLSSTPASAPDPVNPVASKPSLTPSSTTIDPVSPTPPLNKTDPLPPVSPPPPPPVIKPEIPKVEMEKPEEIKPPGMKKISKKSGKRLVKVAGGLLMVLLVAGGLYMGRQAVQVKQITEKNAVHVNLDPLPGDEPSTPVAGAFYSTEKTGEYTYGPYTFNGKEYYTDRWFMPDTENTKGFNDFMTMLDNNNADLAERYPDDYNWDSDSMTMDVTGNNAATGFRTAWLPGMDQRVDSPVVTGVWYMGTDGKIHFEELAPAIWHRDGDSDSTNFTITKETVDASALNQEGVVWQDDSLNGFNSYLKNASTGGDGGDEGDGGDGGSSPNPSATPNPSPPPVTCYDQCTSDTDCSGVLKCQAVAGVNRCVNTACPTEADCICPTYLCTSLTGGSAVKIGDTETFTCTGGNFSSLNPVAYFRQQVEGNPLFITSAAIPLNATQTASYDITIDQPGNWLVQCKVCTDNTETDCTTWGQAN